MTAPRLTCQDAIAILADYLESVLDEGMLAALERHLRDCPPCRAYLNTYRKTRQLAGQAGRVAMPAEMKRRLHQLLRAELVRRDA